MQTLDQVFEKFSDIALCKHSYAIFSLERHKTGVHPKYQSMTSHYPQRSFCESLGGGVLSLIGVESGPPVGMPG